MVKPVYHQHSKGHIRRLRNKLIKTLQSYTDNVDLQADVMRDMCESNKANRLMYKQSELVEYTEEDDSFFMTDRNFYQIKMLKKLCNEANNARGNSFQKLQILSSVSPFYTAFQLRKIGFRFSNDIFAAANLHAKKYGPGRNLRLGEPSELRTRLKYVVGQFVSKKRTEEIKKDLEEFFSSKGITESSSRTMVHIKKDDGATIHEAIPVRKLCLASFSEAYHHYKSYMTEKGKEEGIVHRSTFYKYIPHDVKILTNRTDVCPYCNLFDLLKSKVSLSEEEKIDFEACRLHKEFVNNRKEDFDKARANLQDNEGIILMDYKENISIGSGPVQVSHEYFGRPQRTLFGMALYYKENNSNTSTIKKQHVDIISDALNHSSSFAIESIGILMELPIYKQQKFNKISFWSDNARHFKSKEMLSYCYDIKKNPNNNMKSVEWNFSTQYHGKSDIDRHFALLSNIQTKQSTADDCYSSQSYIDIVKKVTDRTNQDKKEDEKVNITIIEHNPVTLKHYNTYEIQGFSDYYRFEFLKKDMIMSKHEVYGDNKSVKLNYKTKLFAKSKVGADIDIHRGFSEKTKEESQSIQVKGRMRSNVIDMIKEKEKKETTTTTITTTSTSSSQTSNNENRIKQLNRLTIAQLKLQIKSLDSQCKIPTIKKDIINLLIEKENQQQSKEMVQELKAIQREDLQQHIQKQKEIEQNEIERIKNKKNLQLGNKVQQLQQQKQQHQIEEPIQNVILENDNGIRVENELVNFKRKRFIIEDDEEEEEEDQIIKTINLKKQKSNHQQLQQQNEETIPKQSIQGETLNLCNQHVEDLQQSHETIIHDTDMTDTAPSTSITTTKMDLENDVGIDNEMVMVDEQDGNEYIDYEYAVNTILKESIIEDQEIEKSEEFENKISSLVRTFEKQLREGKNNFTHEIQQPQQLQQLTTSSQPSNNNNNNSGYFSFNFLANDLRLLVQKIIQLCKEYFKGSSDFNNFNISFIPLK